MHASCLLVLALTAVIHCTRFRKCMYSLMCRISVSMNKIVQSFEYSDVYNTSVLRMKWTSAIYTLL